MWSAGAVVLAAALALPAAPAPAAESIQVIETPGSGDLTMCRSWFMFDTCDDYHHIVIPGKVKVGDSLRLVFGSNLKIYKFPVARILIEGEKCLLLSNTTGATEHVNRVVASPCKWAVH